NRVARGGTFRWAKSCLRPTVAFGVVPDGTMVLGADHEQTIVHYAHMVELIAEEGVRAFAAFMVVAEATGDRVAHVQATTQRADPHPVPAILRETGDMRALGSAIGRGEMFHALTIVAVQAVLGTDPDMAVAILQHAGDRIVRQAVLHGE